MEFPGGLQTKEDITDGDISDSDLVASSTDKLSVGTDLMHQSHIHQLYNSNVVLCLQYPPENSMASTLFPHHTVQRHIVPNVLMRALQLNVRKYGITYFSKQSFLNSHLYHTSYFFIIIYF